jgi:penicillin-insensitive murein DD-endopeptidase
MKLPPVIGITLSLLLPCALGLAAERILPARWSAQTAPAAGPARVIGSANAGCVQGAIALPFAGRGFEVLHPSRIRYYGHPTLVEYVQRLTAAMVQHGLPALLVGDLSQPRGGPTPTGHASHQSGLDVDLAYTRPADALWRPLDPGEREHLDFVPVVDLGTRTPMAAWNSGIPELLELAASDPAVDRLFVSPVVKRELCNLRPGAAWLARLRPWWGHHDHFHVRLKCPAGSPDCRPQDPPPAGDGCGAELDWWFSAEASPPTGRPAHGRAQALPASCARLLQ